MESSRKAFDRYRPPILSAEKHTEKLLFTFPKIITLQRIKPDINMKDKSVQKLRNQIEEIETTFAHLALTNTSISSASVGWHLEHAMLVLNAVIESMKKSDPAGYKQSFNLKKLIIFSRRKFPRGRGKAPKAVTPTEQPNAVDVQHHLEKTKLALAELPTLNKAAFFKHPLFGHLRQRDAIRFLEIHTEHHLRIVREIVGKTECTSTGSVTTSERRE